MTKKKKVIDQKKKKAKQSKATIIEPIIINNNPLFQFINPASNDKFLDMDGIDLQQLIVLLDDFYISLRKKLGFDNNITFGMEIEFENAMRKRIDLQLQEAFPNGYWKTKYDGSLHNGAEISSPVLSDKENNWKELKKVCSIVEPFAAIGKRSGGHIHVGTQTLGSNRDSWLNFIKLWSVYENIIYRFIYGEFLTARPSMLKYAEPMTKDFWRDYEILKREHASLYQIISKISHKRYQAVNFNNVDKDYCNRLLNKNTIEFRCPNSSLDPSIWQNNINLFVNLLLYSKNSLFNDDIVEKRYQLNKDSFNKLEWYDEIYLEQALELCDMIFSNNLDKLYFLRQYLKSFEVCKNRANYEKAKVMTRKQ